MRVSEEKQCFHSRVVFLVVCGGARTATQRGRVSSHLSGEEPVCESTCYLPMQGSLQNDAQLLAPSEAFGLLHVLECFLVLTILSVHSHACNDNGGNASRDAEAPINSGIHVVCEREEDVVGRLLGRAC